MKEWIWSGKLWTAFKNGAIIFSFAVNVVVLIFLVLAFSSMIPLTKSIVQPLVGGLHQSFVDMSEANITRTIVVNDNIPVVFDLPVQTETVAVLTQPVPMSIPTTFVLPAGGGFINGDVSFELPVGTELPVRFDTTVPVSETVPVELAVAVNIPLKETELYGPFSDLQALFAPIDRLLIGLPDSNAEFFDRLINGNEGATQEVQAEQTSNP